MKKVFIFLIMMSLWASFHNILKAQHDLPALHVEGQWIKNSNGDNVTLRGLNVIDPRWLRQDMQSMENAINKVAELHARVVRLPVHPSNWNGDAYYNSYLKPTIDYCREKGLYVIIDWHYIGRWGEGQEEIARRTHEFWSYVAPRHKDDTHVLFEFMNEPSEPRERTLQTWNLWKEWAQPFVDTIRYYAPDNIILVGSPHWSQLCQFAPQSPFEGKNLAYVMHLYPAWPSSNWPTLFGEASKSVPIVITEWGYGTYPGTSGREYHGTTSGFGIPFRNFLENHPNISWTAWVYHYAWNPWMIDRQYNLLGGNNFMGQFTAEWLYDKKDSDLAYAVHQETNVWEEAEGVIIIEAENNDSDFPALAAWAKESSTDYEGFSGEGYVRFNKQDAAIQADTIEYQDADLEKVLVYWIRVNQPGVYIAKIRSSQIGDVAASGAYMSVNQSPFIKLTGNESDEWDWTQEEITFEFEEAGTYRLDLLGSTFNFLIDRIVLYNADLTFDELELDSESEIINAHLVDSEAPSRVENINFTEITTTGAIAEWDPAIDNVEVAGYNVYVNFRKVNTSLLEETNFTFANLAVNTEYNVRIEAIDWAGNTSMSQPVTLTTAAITTRVNELKDNPFTVYPNPGTGLFRIHSEDLEMSRYSIQVVDMNGKTQYIENVSGEQGVVDISHLHNGIYIFKISYSDGRIFIQKVNKF
jgi:endoglucanase